MALSNRFFGFVVHKPLSGDSPQTPLHSELGYGAVRLSSAGVKWWEIETSDGVYDFDRFDALVNLYESHNIRCYLELGLVPDFHTDDPSENHSGYHAGVPNDWDAVTNYVDAVVSRYGERIDYGLGNEPDNSTFWAGTEEEYLTFTTRASAVILAGAPGSLILSPSVTPSGAPWLDRWLAAGGADQCNAIGFHPYVQPKPPEDMVQLVRYFRDIARKNGLGSAPLYATEQSWHQYRDEGDLVNLQWTTDPGDTPMPDALAASYMARELLGLAIAGVRGTYHYGLDEFDFDMIRLLDENDLTALSAGGDAFAYLATVLDGATLYRFRQVPPLYTVDWSKIGERGRILWCDDDETQSVDLTEFTSGTDVLGDPITLSASYEVTHSPVFVTR